MSSYCLQPIGAALRCLRRCFAVPARETTVQVVRLTQSAILPTYGTSGAAGMDLYADLGAFEPLCIQPGERFLVSTGIAIRLPEGMEGQIRPRSGLALKQGVTVLNSPGTIDSDYRGGVGVILFNAGSKRFEIRHGDRIAQLVVAPVLQVSLREVAQLDDTVRGKGGFGSTGRA